MDMIAAFNDVGSYRGAAAICGAGPQDGEAGAGPLILARQRPGRTTTTWWPTWWPGGCPAPRPAYRPNACCPKPRAVGYTGSARLNFRRLVAKTKGAWRSGHRRGRRPGVGGLARCLSSTGA